jgi:hypothetical protein
MNNFRKALLTLSVVGLGSIAAAPAFAQAFASGSSTIVLMNGASQSVGAEISLPTGFAFEGANATGDVLVTPLLADTTAFLAVNEQAIESLNLNAGPAIEPPSTAPVTFTAAAALALNTVTGTGDLQAQVSIIRAGAGVDGLE